MTARRPAQRPNVLDRDGGAPPGVPPSCHWTALIDDRAADGAAQMAADMALLAAVAPDTAFLRLYRWAAPCLSFGRHEPATRRYRRDRIEASGVDVVRRPTGGRAVWHDAEVTYAVAAPTAVFGSLRDAYITIHHMLATALSSFGATVDVAPTGRSPRPDAGACFASPVGGEIVAEGKKLVGSAQVRDRHAFLQHGSILLRNDQERVRALSVRPGTPVPAVGLEEILGRRVEFDEVASVAVETASRTWPGPWHRGADLPGPPDLERFRDPAWTWSR